MSQLPILVVPPLCVKLPVPESATMTLVGRQAAALQVIGAAAAAKGPQGEVSHGVGPAGLGEGAGAEFADAEIVEHEVAAGLVEVVEPERPADLG